MDLPTKNSTRTVSLSGCAPGAAPKFRRPSNLLVREGPGRCGFVLWKEANGRYVDRTTAETLLKNGETGVKVGFSPETVGV